jgi:FkbM family methyltransferase
MELDPLLKMKILRKATKAFGRGVSAVGRALPLPTKVWLARRSSKLGYLLCHDGDFPIPDYLGSFHVYINTNYASERAMLTGKYEQDLWSVVSRFVSPGDTCLDIGANVGAVTLFLAKTVGASGKVIGFEPGPAFFQRLKRNVDLNPDLKPVVELFNIGLADKEGVLHWAEDPEFPGNAYMFGESGTEVRVLTLDAVLGGGKLSRLDFIKVDVEGMEWEVLSGARNLIRKFRPKIFFESLMDFETFRGVPIRKLTAELLAGLGYELYSVSSDGSLKAVAYPDFSANTLALPV